MFVCLLFYILQVEDLTDTELTKKKNRSSQLILKSGKKVNVSLVEGSFRRIMGIRECIDDSGSFIMRRIEIKREPGKSLGFYIRKGDGWFRKDGIFVSRLNLGSFVETNGLLRVGDEITRVNDIDVTRLSLQDVCLVMQYVEKMILTIKVLNSFTFSQKLSTLRKRGLPATPSSYQIAPANGSVKSRSDSYIEEPYSKTNGKILSDSSTLEKKQTRFISDADSMVKSNNSELDSMFRIKHRIETESPYSEISYNPEQELESRQKNRRYSSESSEINPYAKIKVQDGDNSKDRIVEVDVHPYQEVTYRNGGSIKETESNTERRESDLSNPYEVISAVKSTKKDSLLNLLRTVSYSSSSPDVKQKSDTNDEHVINPDHIYAQVDRQRKYSSSTEGNDENEREFLPTSPPPPPLPTSPLPHDESMDRLHEISQNSQSTDEFQISHLSKDEALLKERSDKMPVITADLEINETKHDPDFKSEPWEGCKVQADVDVAIEEEALNELEMEDDGPPPPLPPPYVPDISPPESSSDDDDNSYNLEAEGNVPAKEEGCKMGNLINVAVINMDIDNREVNSAPCSKPNLLDEMPKTIQSKDGQKITHSRSLSDLEISYTNTTPPPPPTDEPPDEPPEDLDDKSTILPTNDIVYSHLPTTTTHKDRVGEVSNLMAKGDDKFLSGMMVVKVQSLDASNKKCRTFWAEYEVQKVNFTMIIDDKVKLCMNIPILTKEALLKKDKEVDEYQILLLKNSQVIFSLNPLCIPTLSEATLLNDIFPLTKEISKNVYIDFQHYGHLNLSLEYHPMSSVIHRMDPGAYTQPSFSDFVSLNPNNTGCPLILERCIETIEQYGLKTPHLYERSAPKSHSKRAYKSCMDALGTQSIKNGVVKCSVHAYTGLIVNFFCDLPEPFFTNDISSSLTQAASVGSRADILDEFIECLPEEVSITLRLLVDHFKTLCKHSEANGVTIKSISQLFGPLLLIPALTVNVNTSTTALEYAEDYEAQARVIELLLSRENV